MISIDIFYKSYHKDFKLLLYSLRSLTKNVSGYNTVVILIPENEKNLFDTRILPERTVIHYVPEYGNGYLLQQVYKIKAHNYCSADFILFTDSDCIFDHPINLQEVFKDNKPEILYTDYNKVGDAICWKKCTEDFMNDTVSWEYMRRNCLIYHSSTLAAINNLNKNLEYSIMQSGRFSEFNAIGAFASKYERDKYSFVNTDNWTYTPALGIQLWSHFQSGNDALHIEEKARALKVINEALNMNLTEL